MLLPNQTESPKEDAKFVDAFGCIKAATTNRVTERCWVVVSLEGLLLLLLLPGSDKFFVLCLWSLRFVLCVCWVFTASEVSDDERQLRTRIESV